jgi:exo-beta-1,3-glucanase (GH17 family)
VSHKFDMRLNLIISCLGGICLSAILLLGLRVPQGATSETLVPEHAAIKLVADQMKLIGHFATLTNTRGYCTESWLSDVPTGTIILGVYHKSCDPADWGGGSATAEIFLTEVYSPTVVVLELLWPDQGGRGLRSPDRDRIAAITLDGQPLWNKRTTRLGTSDYYYGAEHSPILTTIVLTQSITHTLTISVPARTAWDLSHIEMTVYSYPTTFKGIGYSPFRDCQYPGGASQPSVQDIKEDLFRLSHTSNAIRTYSARGVNGQIPAMANEIGLRIFAGAWIDGNLDDDDDEVEALIGLACESNLEGVIVGNEYFLRSERTQDDIDYLLQRIRQVKDGIIQQCGKNVPVTTAEIDNLMFEWGGLDDFQPEMDQLYGQIISETDFVMVHIYPFWQEDGGSGGYGQAQQKGMPIEGAANFTVERYKAIQALIERKYPGQNKWIIIGEAGWPSSGMPNGVAVPSLENQRRYMLEFLYLAERARVEFMYFDAFDELWKIEESGRVGQHWGYSYSDRTAKYNFYGVLLPWKRLFPYQVYLPYIANQSAPNMSHSSLDVEFIDTLPRSLIRASGSPTFPVFTEWPMGPGHFVPSGWMGDINNIELYECDRDDPHGGEMAIRASFSPTGTLGRAGIYWQYPENNWGTISRTFDLSYTNKLTFWAKGKEGDEKIRFFVGGIGTQDDPYPESLRPEVSTGFIPLTKTWKEYTINLRGKDLTRVIGGFGWATDQCASSDGATFYLDDIVFGHDPDLPEPPAPGPIFSIYTDAAAQDNHYFPSGWMGDTGDIRLDECGRTITHTGSTAIRVEYTAEGIGPYEGCEGLPPCNWAGVYWQHPAENWGDRPGGYDLTGARALTFWARGENGGERVSFMIGGVGCGSGDYPDSLCPVRVFDPAPTVLTDTWQVYTVPLSADLDLSGLVGGFLWTVSKADNPGGATFYLDDIQYHFNIDTPSSFPFSTPPIPIGSGSRRTFDLAFGDADNDGWRDLAVGNHAPNQVCWNNGDYTFDCEDAFGGSATFDVDWGHMNEDDYLDLVVANSQGHSNLVCLNNRDRTFTCNSFGRCTGTGGAGGALCHTALADVDGKYGLDIALGIRWGWRLHWIYFNDGTGTFPASTITATFCNDASWTWTLDMAFGDVDNDDDLDLAVATESPDYVCINDGTGTFTEARWLTWRTDSTRSVVLGDADGDGDLDIAIGGHYNNPIELFLNDGHGYFTETLPLFIGPASDTTGDLAWGDVDKDGDLDLAVGNYEQPDVVYFNDPVTATNSITFTRKIRFGSVLNATNSVAFGDVDNDCDLDLALSRDGGQDVIYLNTLLGGCVHLPAIMKNYP